MIILRLFTALFIIENQCQKGSFLKILSLNPAVTLREPCRNFKGTLP